MASRNGKRVANGHSIVLPKGLGWLSLGLGLAELTAPRRVSRLIGIEDSVPARSTLRALGAREIASGVGVLARPRHPLPVWLRVAGDIIDLGFLGWALQRRRTDRQRLLGTAVAVLGVTALDAYAVRQASRRARPVKRSITIGKPPAEVYAFYRDFERLPTFMEHLDSVRIVDARRSRWVARLPGGVKLEWVSELTEDRPSERIAWRSVEGSEVPHHGSVRFRPAPDGRSTELLTEILFEVPSLAKLFADMQVAGDLRRLKQVMETGEVVHSDASIHRGRHPARPSARRSEHEGAER